jgi:hypothetical protein
VPSPSIFRPRRGRRAEPRPQGAEGDFTVRSLFGADSQGQQTGYGLNYLLDIENAVIIDVEATPARTYDEVAATKTMIDRTERCFALGPSGSPPLSYWIACVCVCVCSGRQCLALAP